MGKDKVETPHWELLSPSVGLSQMQGVFEIHRNDQIDIPVVNLPVRPISIHLVEILALVDRR